MLAVTHDPLTGELATMWADLLGVPVVLPEDDFFRLGGNSLLAARLVLRVRDVYRVRFPVYALYEAGTLREFAAQRGERCAATRSTAPRRSGRRRGRQTPASPTTSASSSSARPGSRARRPTPGAPARCS
ncbi:phosphopantetheine-binding protein [Nannocystis pusilla]